MGMIIGIIVGAIVVLGGIGGGLAYYFLKVKKSKSTLKTTLVPNDIP